MRNTQRLLSVAFSATLAVSGLLFMVVLAGCDDSSSATTAPRSVDPKTFESCEELDPVRDQELALIQRCTTAADCGQVLANTGCGCSRNLVARLDANTTLFNELLARGAELGCGRFISVCDCPATDGFACVDNLCTWNYL